MNDLAFNRKSYKHEGEDRFFYDYLISGKPLSEMVSLGKGLVGMLGYWGKEQDKRHIDLLTKKIKPELSTGRVTLYGCVACGDIACGGITIRVEFSGNKVYWRELGSEDLDGYSLEGFEKYQEFEFEVNQYFHAFASLKDK